MSAQAAAQCDPKDSSALLTDRDSNSFLPYWAFLLIFLFVLFVCLILYCSILMLTGRKLTGERRAGASDVFELSVGQELWSAKDSFLECSSLLSWQFPWPP